MRRGSWIYQSPNWRKIQDTKRKQETEPVKEPKAKKSLIKPPPCTTCPRAAGSGCHKPVEPGYKTICKEWDAWFRESWPIVTRAIRGEDK